MVAPVGSPQFPPEVAPVSKCVCFDCNVSVAPELCICMCMDRIVSGWAVAGMSLKSAQLQLHMRCIVLQLWSLAGCARLHGIASWVLGDSAY